ncbi:MAG: bifunctional phosphoribosylaminoimidazolecarboxamide formyltransferase/IMP cyclohydrolase, partial [Candidatus Rokubacteria bacterium]|nr:bifunctional phosphoribosylaminoimidazolecarboxamide formyltransferase/IMP cyclohydrolase [Candidatus Rokubacteria bacterium]
VDEEAAQFLSQQYIECILAPQFSVKAMDRLRAKKDLRLVTLPSMLLSANEIELRTISGGVYQTPSSLRSSGSKASTNGS